MNIFEVATRRKYRFAHKGVISTEDLWNLSLESLDAIYKRLIAEQKEANEESLLKAKTSAQNETDIKIEIIKHIVSVKLEEVNARSLAKENKEKKQMLLGIIAEKENKTLREMSTEQLKEMVDKL